MYGEQWCVPCHMNFLTLGGKEHKCDPERIANVVRLSGDLGIKRGQIMDLERDIKAIKRSLFKAAT